MSSLSTERQSESKDLPGSGIHWVSTHLVTPSKQGFYGWKALFNIQFCSENISWKLLFSFAVSPNSKSRLAFLGTVAHTTGLSFKKSYTIVWVFTSHYRFGVFHPQAVTPTVVVVVVDVLVLVVVVVVLVTSDVTNDRQIHNQKEPREKNHRRTMVLTVLPRKIMVFLSFPLPLVSVTVRWCFCPPLVLRLRALLPDTSRGVKTGNRNVMKE